ncbi:Putative Fe-S cluster [Desulfacinum infernum DSM 9756]|uniref:Putative Fe-S cluster n=1 Tax=Desulfacinum infernum DSM 9756 TaxID=1121391 RepID=A0A1M4SL24_9BACT|nr:(Fe-S)-binding protein [Desulfacinum infernum]SHE32885.1 Putative Fe-S cluster [Desulfacinum infernum DSM 9756]
MDRLNALKKTFDEVERRFPRAPRMALAEVAPRRESLQVRAPSFEDFLGEMVRNGQTALSRTAWDAAAILGRFFGLSHGGAAWTTRVEQSLRDLLQMDGVSSGDAAREPRKACLRLFRRLWFEGAPNGAGSDRRFPGMAHAARVGFFERVPLEVTPWVRWILQVEHYHRTDPERHEGRLDRYRYLRWERPDALLTEMEDVLVWTEQELFRGVPVTLEDKANLCARALENRLAPGLRFPEPIPALIYLLMRCHRFCLAEVVDPRDDERAHAVEASRELHCLTDLMLVIYRRCLNVDPLPDPAAVLEELMQAGFNLEHESFKDPYTACLVPPEETPQFDESVVRLFADPDSLTGDLEKDCEAAAASWLEVQRRVLAALLGEVRDMRSALEQPLPRKDLLRRCARFLVSWALSGHVRGEVPSVPRLAERVRGALPEELLRRLVRQRRGFEVPTRKEFQALVEKECSRQIDVLEKALSDGRLEGEGDFHVMVRLAALSGLPFPEEEAPEGFQWACRLEDVLKRLESAGKAPELLTKDFRFFLETPFPPGGTPFEMLEAVRCVVPREAILVALQKEGISEPEAAGAYDRVLGEFAGAFHKLAVASRRSPDSRFHPRLEDGDLTRILAVLAAPLGELKGPLEASALEAFQARANCFQRRDDGLLLLSDEEWEAAAVHGVVTTLGPDLPRMLETHKPEWIRSILEEQTEKWQTLPEVSLRNPLRRLILKWIGPGEDAEPDPEIVQDVMARLPGLDCGSCGEPRCRRFALGLIRGRYQPGGCVHLTARQRGDLQQKLEHFAAGAPGARLPRSVFQLMTDPDLWRRVSGRHPLKRAVENALDVKRQKARRLFFQKLETLWEALDRKPDIYRRPDEEAFYRALVDTVGFDATERITGEERRWLVQHGSRRLEAEWDRLELRRDWLKLSRLKVASRPRLEEADPATLAERAYERVFYLNQLDGEDRRRVLLRRLEAHEDGFSQWWNQDLVSMNHPNYLIDNWEEFSKVVKNAYWHQEDFPAPLRLGREIFQGWSEGDEAEAFTEDWIRFLVGAEAKSALGDGTQEAREAASRPQEGGARKILKNPGDLRRELEVLAAGIEREREDRGSPGAKRPAARTRPLRDALWEAFQRAGYRFHPDFSVPAEDLEPSERDLSRLSLPEAVRASVEAVARKWEQEAQVAAWLEDVLIRSPTQSPPLSALEAWIRRELRTGSMPREVEERIRGWFAAHPHWKVDLLTEWIGRLAAMARWEELVAAFAGVVVQGLQAPSLRRFAESHPNWFEKIREAVRQRGDFDRERLLHYLFVLAKMEGNLDVITGLLREIRETSDVIEAAWLQFTKDRLAEGSPPALPRTVPPRIPLLAGKVKDLEALHRSLTGGVSRSEKRTVADAVRELLLFMRFHIVQLSESQEDPREAFQAFLDAGYSLEGLDTEALREAFGREWQRRAAHRQNRIWILTMAVARRCAALSTELQEADRAFAKVRQSLLKEDGTGEMDSVCRRRGIALGRVKEQVYRELSELLERERLESFRKRIRQIVHQLDRKRLEIVKSWVCGEVNRFSVFHILRQRQKEGSPPTAEDFRRFILEQWTVRVEELRSGGKEGARERLLELDESFQALLGVSPLSVEEEARAEAEAALKSWWAEREGQVRRTVGRAFLNG